MGVGILVRAVGLGLALAAALILLWGQPWDPKTIRERWTTRVGFSSRPIVGEVYVWLNARVAAILLVVGLALQVAGGAIGGLGASRWAWVWSIGLMIGLGVVTARTWIGEREPLVTRRLVLACRDANMPDVSGIQFLWHLDQARAVSLVTPPPGLEMDVTAGAPPGPVAQRLLADTAYGAHPVFRDLEVTLEGRTEHP